MTATCETCRFWEHTDEYEGGADRVGHCRRFPPSIHDADGTPYAMNPLNYATAFCGEHQPRQPAEATPPRPRLDPETRSVLEDAERRARYIAEDIEDGNHHEAVMLAKKSAEAIRAHLAKLDGEGYHG